MKINMQMNTISSEEDQKIVYHMIFKMFQDYKIPTGAIPSFLEKRENSAALVEWVRENLGITMQHFCFSDNNGSYLAHGFDVTEDAHLTAFLMQLDLTKRISVRK